MKENTTWTREKKTRVINENEEKILNLKDQLINVVNWYILSEQTFCFDETVSSSIFNFFSACKILFLNFCRIQCGIWDRRF